MEHRFCFVLSFGALLRTKTRQLIDSIGVTTLDCFCLPPGIWFRNVLCTPAFYVYTLRNVGWQLSRCRSKVTLGKPVIFTRVFSSNLNAPMHTYFCTLAWPDMQTIWIMLLCSCTFTWCVCVCVCLYGCTLTHRNTNTWTCMYARMQTPTHTHTTHTHWTHRQEAGSSLASTPYRRRQIATWSRAAASCEPRVGIYLGVGVSQYDSSFA